MGLFDFSITFRDPTDMRKKRAGVRIMDAIRSTGSNPTLAWSDCSTATPKNRAMEPELKPDLVSVSKGEPKSDVEVKPESKAEPELKLDAEPKTKPEPEPTSVPAAESQPVPDAGCPPVPLAT